VVGYEGHLRLDLPNGKSSAAIRRTEVSDLANHNASFELSSEIASPTRSAALLANYSDDGRASD